MPIAVGINSTLEEVAAPPAQSQARVPRGLPTPANSREFSGRPTRGNSRIEGTRPVRGDVPEAVGVEDLKG